MKKQRGKNNERLNSFDRKRKGFTLIESMIALTIGAAVSLGTIKSLAKVTNSNDNQKIAKEINDIIYAFDQRIAIDGYDIVNWNETSWNNNTFYSNFLKKQLSPSTSTQCKGEWTPITATVNRSLIPCNLWKKSPKGFKLEATIDQDSLGFIENFDMKLKFKNEEDFIEHFPDASQIVLHSKTNKKTTKAGSQTYSFINGSDGSQISRMECIDLKNGCEILASWNSDGGMDYIRIDGKNSLLNSHLTFIEAKGEAPLKCLKWKNTEKDGTGVWTQKEEDCGVGIYEDSTIPVVAEIISEAGIDNITSRNVLLDKECSVFGWDTVTKSVIDTGAKSPCGMLNDSTEIIQILDRTSARDADIENIQSKAMNTSTLVSGFVSSERIEATAELKASLITAATAAGVYIQGKTTISDLLVAKNGMVVEGDFKTLGNTDITGLLSVSDAVVRDSLTVEGDFVVDGLQFNKTTIQKGDRCSVAEVGTKVMGEDDFFLNCIKEGSSYKWLAEDDGVPYGAIFMTLKDKIPDGYIMIKGQSTSMCNAEAKKYWGSTFPNPSGGFLRSSGYDISSQAYTTKSGRDLFHGSNSSAGIKTSEAQKAIKGSFNDDDRNRWQSGAFKTARYNSSNGGAEGTDSHSVDVDFDSGREVAAYADSLDDRYKELRPYNITTHLITKCDPEKRFEVFKYESTKFNTSRNNGNWNKEGSIADKGLRPPNVFTTCTNPAGGGHYCTEIVHPPR